MRATRKLRERIGAVSIPIVGPDPIGIGEPGTSPGEGELADDAADDRHDVAVGDLDDLRISELGVSRHGWPGPVARPSLRLCQTELREGCYRLSFLPAGATSILSTRYRGTLRVERTDGGYRISGDLYRYRLLDDLVVRDPGRVVEWTSSLHRWLPDLEDLLGPIGPVEPIRPLGIPIYARDDYHSYLEGTGARMFSLGYTGRPCRFTLDFDQFEYDHPTSGFSGSFASTPDRSVRMVLQGAGVLGRYQGTAYSGSQQVGTVVLQHASTRMRRATLVIHTLEGAATPAADGGEDFRSVMASAGWSLQVVDGGEVTMPGTISGQDPDDCWSETNLHRLMESVGGYDPDDLDTVWRSHLLAVPAEVGCGRGIVFDHPGGDLNSVAREGSATFSDDGYPASSSANFGSAEDELQRDVPRAFLRSAAHEVGHAFNQIHQSFEGGNDNSIMTVTPAVADAIAADGGSFPGDIQLAFNDTVRRHLMHLPDPAVRPGAMDFFGSAVNAPEPADLSTLPGLSVAIDLGTDQVRLGEPLEASWRLTNTGAVTLPVPSDLDPRALVSRVSVEDPDGNVTFLRPPDQRACAHIGLRALAPGESLGAEAIVFYGRDGFAFTRPGRHTVTVVVLWEIAGEPVLAEGSVHVWVAHPVSREEDEIAALLLDPDVGLEIATRGAVRTDRGHERIRAAAAASKTHPAADAVRRLGLAG